MHNLLSQQHKTMALTVVGAGQPWGPWQQRWVQQVLIPFRRSPPYAPQVQTICGVPGSVTRKDQWEASEVVYHIGEGHERHCDEREQFKPICDEAVCKKQYESHNMIKLWHMFLRTHSKH